MGMYCFALFTVRTGVFAESRFMGKLLDEWINDIQDSSPETPAPDHGRNRRRDSCPRPPFDHQQHDPHR